MPSSVHSVSGRSINSIASTLTTRSRKSTALSQKARVKWWQRRPIIKTAYLLDLQKGSYTAAIITLIESVVLILLSIFDLYCLFEARPGSRHFRSFGISFLFVYSGNKNIRLALMTISTMLLVSAIGLLVTSVILIPALRKEHEIKFRPWLLTMLIFTVFRALTIIFQSIANDLFFTYHQVMFILWFIMTPINVFLWLVVYSNYQELSDIAKMEDIANLKMSTFSSLQGSRSLSQMSHHSLDSSYKHYGATINSNPTPSYIHGHGHLIQQPRGGIYSGGSIASTPTPSIRGLPHHGSTPSLRGGAAYTIPLEMFDLNRAGSVASSTNRIDTEFNI